MSQKKDISEIVDAVDKHFKDLERKRLAQEEFRRQTKPVATAKEPSRHDLKIKEEQEKQKFRIKEKLTHAAIVFVLGHILLIPLYSRYPDYAVNMFICASISLAVMCIAVIDYT